MGDLCVAGPEGTQSMAAFVGMWTAMMIPMMLPSLVPALRQYRCASRGAAAGIGYFTVWIAVGLAVYPLDSAIAALGMRWYPATGILVLAAGLLQFTAWKRRRLACCHADLSRASAWGEGLRLGANCVASCGNLMAVLMLTGMMDTVVMLAVTIAITAERCAPAAARPIGVAVAAAGVLMVASA